MLVSGVELGSCGAYASLTFGFFWAPESFDASMRFSVIPCNRVLALQEEKVGSASI